MLEHIAESLVATTQLISYNGKSFDLSLLVTRCRLAALEGAVAIPALAKQLEALPHLDLLHAVRRAFARCWPDCRLSTVEQRLLAFDRGQDLPGCEAPAAWLDWLWQGNPRRLPDVVEHNRKDLLSLVALIPALSAVYREPLAYGADSLALARYWCKRGRDQQARELLESRLAGNHAASHRESEAMWFLAHLYRRAQDWPRAVSLWEMLARDQHPGALEALAKFHEHRQRDPLQALEYARRLPNHPAREHRCQRLLAKLKRAADGTLDLGGGA
ncbi:hypothetical protein CKO36_08350 [Rhabdochromatium marinum]|nr:hypothetical protein [Rhabdochromatium marinum]